MSSVGMRKRYTSVMEKIIKNAVSESTKVLETVIAELKAEVLSVKNENENLKIRCCQFEEVVKKRSVYRETGTSPEPWIIEKCDKAVQFDFTLQLSEDDDDPNLSGNETQSESSFGPIYEKDPSNDSSSLLKTNDIDDNSDNPLDLSNEAMPEKPVADCGKNISESTVLSPQNEQHEVSDTCCESSEMEVLEVVGITHAETDQSMLESQESGQNELNEKENLPVQEDAWVSIEMEDVICERSEVQSKECESSSLLALPTKSANSSNASQQALEEMTEMDDEINQQSTLSSELETRDSISADTTDTKFGKNFKLVHVPADVSSPPDQRVTLPEDIKITKSPTQSEQTCTEIVDTAVQSVSTENSPAKEAQNTSQPTTPPKSQYFLRRQRCSSVTLEDAMLLLDAVSQQKYKSSPPKKSNAKDSSKNVATPKLVDIPEVTAPLGDDSSNSEEITCTTESSQPNATPSGVTIETVEALELDGGPDNMNIEDQQHQETTWSSKSSWPVETVTDNGVSTSTPIKHKKSTQVTEADSAGLESTDQHDHKEMLSLSTESLSTLVTENTTPNLTSTNLDESMQGVDTNSANVDIEEQAETATSPAKLSRIEPPFDATVLLVTKTRRNRKSSKQSKLLDMEGIASSDKIALDSQQHDPKFLSVISPIRSSSVQLEGDHSEELSAPTEKGETALVTLDHLFQKDNVGMQVDLTLPIDSPTAKALARTVSNPILQTPIETIGNVDQISGHPTHDGSEFQEYDHTDTASSTPITSPLLNPPVQHTVVLKLPGDTGDQSSSVGKVITSSSTLSPAQLSAVVSAVRSTQSKTSPTAPSGGIPSGKKGFVAVPFSLQSVMRPHHKIIVIPRQCKVPSSQTVEKDRAIILKQKSFATESTTTFISVNLEATSGEGNVIDTVDQQQTTLVTTTTPSVNLEATSGEGNVKDTADQQQTTSVTTTTPSVEDTSALTNEPGSSGPVKSPCKNTVQVKLNRIPFPVTSAESVSVADVPVDESRTVVVHKKRGRPPSKKNRLALDSSQPKAQPKEDNLPSPMIGPSPQPSGKETTPTQSSLGENAASTEENQMPTPEQLFPAVAADHSYPQHCMTKSQFLAKLDVSPVVKTSKKADSNEKGAQKASLVDRLRSHLKPHIRTIKKAQNTDTGQDGLSLTIETQDPISTTTTTTTATPQEIPRIDQDEQSGNLPDPVPQNDENKTVTPKTSPPPKNAPNKARVKRKRSPKRNVAPTKTVKARKLKNTGAINENIPTGRKLSPMRNKIINSNALLSCVRKGIKKKSFLCKFCRKEFSKKKDIEIHIQVHVGKKPFQCNICHRRFSRTMELSRHLKRHNSDKKYQCTSCGKSFIEYNNLKRHTYIHTGEKPYSCPHCSRSFTQSGHMRTHIKNKHKDKED